MSATKILVTELPEYPSNCPFSGRPSCETGIWPCNISKKPCGLVDYSYDPKLGRKEHVKKRCGYLEELKRQGD